MNKLSIFVVTSLALSVNMANAVGLPGEYGIRIPLELTGGGSLPDGTIIIGDGNNGGTNPTNPTLPTDPTTPTDPTLPIDPTTPSDCLFNIEDPSNYSVYVTENGNDLMKYYKGVDIRNGYKGELKMTMGTNNYYEMCMNGETPIPVSAPEPEASPGCNYNITTNYAVVTVQQQYDGSGQYIRDVELKYYNNRQVSNGVKGILKSSPNADYKYYEICLNGEEPMYMPEIPLQGCLYDKNTVFWREVSTDESLDNINVFTTMKYNAFGTVDYNTYNANVTYPQGTIDTSYGKKLPSELSKISYLYPATVNIPSDITYNYYRGSFKESFIMSNGQTEFFYESCKD